MKTIVLFVCIFSAVLSAEASATLIPVPLAKGQGPDAGLRAVISQGQLSGTVAGLRQCLVHKNERPVQQAEYTRLRDGDLFLDKSCAYDAKILRVSASQDSRILGLEKQLAEAKAIIARLQGELTVAKKSHEAVSGKTEAVSAQEDGRFCETDDYGLPVSAGGCKLTQAHELVLKIKDAGEVFEERDIVLSLDELSQNLGFMFGLKKVVSREEKNPWKLRQARVLAEGRALTLKIPGFVARRDCAIPTDEATKNACLPVLTLTAFKRQSLEPDRAMQAIVALVVIFFSGLVWVQVIKPRRRKIRAGWKKFKTEYLMDPFRAPSKAWVELKLATSRRLKPRESED